MKLRYIKLLGDTRTSLGYQEYIGRTFRKFEEGDTIIKKVTLYDPAIKQNRKTKVMLKVITVAEKQIEMDVV